MATITAYEIEERFVEAGKAVMTATSAAERIQLLAVLVSWSRVVDRVRAGGDPLLCALERYV